MYKFQADGIWLYLEYLTLNVKKIVKILIIVSEHKTR